MRLRYLYFEITRACNHYCVQCFNNSKYALEGELDTDGAVGIIRNFADQGGEVLQITGGDPFMRKDLPDILAEVANHKFAEVHFSTSGLLLNSARIKWLEGRVNVLCHSLDGFAAEHDFMRGIKCWTQSLRAIRLGKELGFKTFVCSCITPPLWERLDEFVEFLAELGVDHLKLAQIGDVGRRTVPPEWNGKQFETKEVYNRLEVLRVRYRGRMYIQQSFSSSARPPTVEEDGLVCDPKGELYPLIGYLPRHWICGSAYPKWHIDEGKISEFYERAQAVVGSGVQKIHDGQPVNWWTLLHDDLVQSAPSRIYST